MPEQHSYRTLARYGQNVRLVSWTAGASDSYGDPAWSSTSVTTLGRVQMAAGSLAVIRTAAGEDRTADLTCWVTDSVTVAVDPDRGPDLVVAGVTYRVEVVDDVQDNGLKRLDCVRLR